jgi:beta-N-acetylglucosaminidase/uncharacterized protein YgiM (DUF1202 family)
VNGNRDSLTHTDIGRFMMMGKRRTDIAQIIRAMLMVLPLLIVSVLFFFKGETADAAVTGTVTASSLFVREGPGTNYDIMKLNGVQVRLAQGDYVAVSWEEKGWYYITSSFNGKKINGYVSKEFISAKGNIPTGKPTATPTPTGKANGEVAIPDGTTLAVLTDGFPYTGWVVATTLNIRDGAGTNYSIIDTLKDGDKVTVTGVKKSSVGAYWYTINYIKNGKQCTGTTSATYIAVQVRATSTPSPTPSANDVTLRTYGFPLEGKVVADALNVRSTASTSSQRVAILLEGDKVTTLDAVKDSKGTWWYKVKFKKGTTEYTGYVVSDYLSVKSPLPTSTPTPTKTPTPIPTRDPYADIIRYFEIPNNARGSIYYAATVNADVLNLRSAASIEGVPVGKLKQNEKIIVVDRYLTASGHWYKVAAKQNGKVLTGFVSASYVKLDYDAEVNGRITKTGTLLKAKASDSSDTAVNRAGTKVTFAEDDRILLIGEQEVGNDKWFKVRLDDGTVGYLKSTETELWGGNVLLTSPTPTPKPTNTPTPSPRYTSTPTPTTRPTSTPRPSGTPTPVLREASQGYPYNYAGNVITGYGYADVNYSIAVNDKPRGGSFLTDEYGRTIYIRSNVSLALYDRYVNDGTIFRHVRFVYDDKVYYGYIEDSLIKVMDAATAKLMVTPTPIPDMSKLESDEFIELMIAEGFPLNYIDPLLMLHETHPNWVFEADVTGLDWETVLEKEGKAGVNLIPNTAISGMLSTVNGAYDWMTDKYIVFDSPSWVTASKEATAYYMDPRNWLNSSAIFMFETLTYKSKYQSQAQVEELLKGTPFANKTFTFTDDTGKKRTISYAQAFIEAAEYSGVSPYHLVTRVRQEVVTSSGSVSNSVSGTVSGYTGYYNFYNIGAYHSTTSGGAIVNGLKYAKNGSANNDAYNDASLIPWNNPYRAIVGGAYIIAQQYIMRGQDTIYLQKFNVTDISTFSHQYMANVEAPYSEGTKMAKAYSSLDTTVVFKIPVYENMPETAASKPTSKGSPNNVLASLNVYDMDGNRLTLSPAFNTLNETDYYITTTESNNILQIVAVPVSGKATVGGNGTVVVTSNSDVFEIRVKAENGNVRIYRIHASKQ